MSRLERNYKKYIWLIITVTVVGMSALIAFCTYESEKAAQEKARQDEIVSAVYADLEDQYFPLTGVASAIDICNSDRLKILFLEGSFMDNLEYGDMYYNYDIDYVSDDEFKLSADLDVAGSTHKENYSFRCKLKKDGDVYVLTDLETADPYPEFDESVMLTGQAKKDMEERELAFFNAEFHYYWERDNISSKASSSYSSGSSSSGSSSGSSSSGRSYNSGSSGKSIYNDDDVDASDLDVDSYYLDYRDEFENEDDAWDDLEDNPDEW